MHTALLHSLYFRFVVSAVCLVISSLLHAQILKRGPYDYKALDSVKFGCHVFVDYISGVAPVPVPQEVRVDERWPSGLNLRDAHCGPVKELGKSCLANYSIGYINMLLQRSNITLKLNL